MDLYNTWPSVIGLYSFSSVSPYPCCCICQYFIPLMDGYYFIVWVYHILFTYLSVDGHWVISIYWLLWITSLSILVYECLLESQLLILLAICPGGELLDCMIVLCLTFWGTAKLFSSGCAVSHSYQKAQGFQFLHILANTCYFLFLFLYVSF